MSKNKFETTSTTKTKLKNERQDHKYKAFKEDYDNNMKIINDKIEK